MSSIGFLTQRIARLRTELAKAEKAHAPTARLRRQLVLTRSQLLREEVNRARIAPARKALDAQRHPEMPSLFEGSA
jgi:hypothetical protein